MFNSFDGRYAIYLIAVFLLRGFSMTASPAFPQKVDSVKVDTLKVDSLKVDTLKVDTLKVDTLKVDTLKVDTLKVDSVKVDSIYNRTAFTGEELTRGERLFYGLAYPPVKAINCANCHNTRVSDTLNWNPDAMVISTLYKGKSARDLSKILLTPVGKKMAEVHKDFKLTPEDITLIKAYMDEFTRIGLQRHKPVITNLLLFILTSLLFLFCAVDLVITKKIKRRWILYGVLTATLIYIASSLALNAIKVGRSKDYSPDQPVKFSHFVHAGQNKTDCIYCHSFAQISKTAGIPPVNVCMNCHLLVRNGTRSGAIEIAKIINAHDNNVPIEWIKVHNLPDYVFFSHAQHTGPGAVACSDCHGDVAKMNLIVQVSDLSMGWCVNCHRTRNINFSGNRFYSDYHEMADRVRSGRTDTVTINMLGGTECMKCHY